MDRSLLSTIQTFYNLMKHTSFKDHFSNSSKAYRKYRPSYPDAMFEYLTAISPSAGIAWDCATGSGQAVEKLAWYFDKVIATDASRQQIENARPGENVEYKVAHAEDAPIDSGSVDLITVAQALHWFDTGRFFQEAKRVLKSNGIIAVWSYNLLSVTPGIDRTIKKIYEETLGAYWPKERRLVEEGYKNIPFPFRRVTCPDFKMYAEWSFDDLLGYIYTWSAVKRYSEQNGNDHLKSIGKELSAKWGKPTDRHNITWPLEIIIGKNST